MTFSRNLTQMKEKDIAPLREKLLLEQEGKCLLSGEDITGFDGNSLDHQHKFRYQTNGEDGNGLIRGVLSREMNVLEGKIWNSCNRYLNPKSVQERIDFLQRLIAFYERGTLPFIHPSEKVKELKVSKRNYNKLAKLYKESGVKKKFPEYPKSAKITIALKGLFEMFEIEPYN